MSLTPQDIQTQQFHVRLRGFDAEEVDAFLEKVAEEFLVLLEENKQLEKRAEELARELSAYRAQEKSFQNAMLAAQNIVDQMKEKSRHESESLVANASREATRLRDEARQEVMALEKEVERLTNLKTEAQEAVRQLILSYLERLEMPLSSSARTSMAEKTSKTIGSTEGAAPSSKGSSSAQETNSAMFTPAPGTGLAGHPRQFAEKSTQPKPGTDAFAALYQQIDLSPDRLSGPAADSPADQKINRSSDDEILMMSENGEEAFAGDRLFSFAEGAGRSRLPDLEGDMSFSLDDPLEDSEPAVSFDDEAGLPRRAIKK